MIVLEITKRSDGTRKEFSFPESLAEVTLVRFVIFKETIEPKKPKSMVGYEECKTDAEREKLAAGLEPSEFQLWQDYFILFAMYWAQLPEDFAAELKEEEVMFLYANVARCLNQFTFQPEQESFKHDGVVYNYPNAPINPFYGKKEYLKGNRLIDTITAMQFDMFSTQLGKSQWNVLPKIVAILCKKKGEEMPLNSVEREKWIDDRAKKFETLPLSDALNVAFFLSCRKIISLSVSSQFSSQHKTGHLIKELSRFGNVTGGTQFTNKLHNQVYSTA